MKEYRDNSFDLCDEFQRPDDIFDFIFLQDFNGYGLESVVVDGFLDFSECAFADGPANCVEAEGEGA